MLHLCARLNFGFSSTSNFVIKKLEYLVAAPPKRPASSFALFVSKHTKGKQDIEVTEKMAKAGKRWKEMSEEEKSTYVKKSQKLSEEYKKAKGEYEEKYVVPFKSINHVSLATKSFFQNKEVNVEKGAKIQEYSKQTAELMKKLTPEQIEGFKAEANKIKQERVKFQEEFKFPKRLYHTQASFTRNHPDLKTQTQKKLAFEKYVSEWKLQVHNWLTKNNVKLSLKDFLRLYNRTRKASLPEKGEKEEEL